MFFGRTYCWAYVCTAKSGEDAHMVCNHAGEPGHEIGGDMHSVSEDKREYVRMNSKLFRPGPSQTFWLRWRPSNEEAGEA